MTVEIRPKTRTTNLLRQKGSSQSGTNWIFYHS